MITLSTKAREATKVGLAMVVGYYLALRFEFFSPTWVATTIAFISLPTAGQSLRQAGLRVGGTLVAFVVGLAYLALFPQDRWLFGLSISPFLFLVAYMVQGRKGQYFWFVLGFVTMMITTAGPGSPEHAFKFAAYRSLETLLGIAVWAAVSILVWPQTNIEALKDVSRRLLDTHRDLMRRYRERIHAETGVGDGDGDGSWKESRNRAGSILTQLEQTMNAAAAESYRVQEVRRHWRRLLQLAREVVEILDRLDAGHTEMQKGALRRIIVNEETLLEELEERLEEARRLLAGEAPGRPCRDVTISVDRDLVAKLDHFDRAAVEVTRSELERLDDLVQQMVACVQEIEGHPAEDTHSRAGEEQHATGTVLPTLDPDRVRGALVVVTAMWAGFLIWIFLDPPGHISWYQLVPNLTLVAVQAPFVRLRLLKPFGYAYSVGLVVYVFVMPQLSTFWQLGLLLFAFSFVAAYFFKGIGRAAVFLSVFMILGITNEQSYDFAATANTFLFTMLALLVVSAMGYLLRSPRPEKAFVVLVRRFFRSCEFTLSRLAAEHLESSSLRERLRRAYNHQQLATLPDKLLKWGGQIDSGHFPSASPERIGTLVASLQVLVYRLEDLVSSRRAAHSPYLVEELTADIRAWRSVLEGACRRWSERPGTDRRGDLQEGLSKRLATLDGRIERVLNGASEDDVSAEQSARFYRLLGGFRGLSESALVFAGTAEDVDWKQLREERFS